MYIYHFIKALDLLRSPNVPQFTKRERTGVIYFDKVRRKDLTKGIGLPAKGDTFLLGVNLQDIGALRALDITEQQVYIDRLERKTPRLSGYEPTHIKAALYEAVWLYDMILQMPEEYAEHVIAKTGGDFLDLYAAVCADETCLRPAIETFFSPINQEIFVAKFFYFVWTYVKFRAIAFGSLPQKGDGQSAMPLTEYEDELHEVLQRYKHDRGHVCWRAMLRTQTENVEFDRFIQQLSSATRQMAYYETHLMVEVDELQ